MYPLIAIVGPTGTGKSALALHLALRFKGEIVNADSRQVYRHMEVGVAKPSQEDRQRVPHHLYDIVDPDEPFSLALYLDLAKKAIAGIHQRGRIPILAGGTGQYLWALLEGWEAPRVPPQPELRQRLMERAKAEGPQALYQELQRVDPVAAASIDPRNVRRVVRALEVYYTAGVAPSRARGKRPPQYRALILGLTSRTRQELYQRLDARLEAMLKGGWLQEVRQLLERGYSPDLPSLSSMGYRELAQHLEGRLSLEEALQRIRAAHRRLVRHQYAWFRPRDPRIRWLLALEGSSTKAEGLVEEFLKAQTSCGAQEAEIH